ncbi:MAG: hypothetical protein AAFX53_04295 [Bacteroidota bacterium]
MSRKNSFTYIVSIYVFLNKILDKAKNIFVIQKIFAVILRKKRPCLIFYLDQTQTKAKGTIHRLGVKRICGTFQGKEGARQISVRVTACPSFVLLFQ